MNDKIQELLEGLTKVEMRELYEVLKVQYESKDKEIQYPPKIGSEGQYKVPSPTVSCFHSGETRKTERANDNPKVKTSRYNVVPVYNTIDTLEEVDEKNYRTEHPNSIIFDSPLSSDNVNDLFTSNSDSDGNIQIGKTNVVRQESNIDLGSYSALKFHRNRRYSGCDGIEYLVDTTDCYYISDDTHSCCSQSFTSRSVRPDSPRLNSLRDYGMKMFTRNMTQSEVDSDSVGNVEISEIKEVSDMEENYNLS